MSIMVGGNDVKNKQSRPRTWERRINDARKKHRTSLKNWSKDHYADERQSDFYQLRQPIFYNESSYRIKSIPKLNAFHLSVKEFLSTYEKQSLPIIITNIPEKEQWKAWTDHHWTFTNLLQQYGKEYFKCGEDDDGYKINIRLKYFFKYIHQNQDDSPLYIFDSAYGDIPSSSSSSTTNHTHNTNNNNNNDTNTNNVTHSNTTNKPKKKTNEILQDYQVPSYFPYDLFESVGEKRRPPYRWFLIGPKRSGSTIHIDPLGTSAWNTLIVGRKRWILFPPGFKKDFVKGKEVMLKGEDDEAINYFVDIFPRMKEKYLSIHSAREYSNVWAYEFIQEAGETVFVPSGWWHTVLNLEDTIAITQNYCSYNNFDAVWRKTREGRKKMAVKWLKQLQQLHPSLYERAWELNHIDQYQMKYWKKATPQFPFNRSSIGMNAEFELQTDRNEKKEVKTGKKSQREVVELSMEQEVIKKKKKIKRSYEELQETNTDTTKETNDEERGEQSQNKKAKKKA